jgi:MYXO-CTERM domain-containing protein
MTSSNRAQRGWKRTLAVAALAAVTAWVAAPAHAATQVLSGSHFDVIFDDSALGLFGAPSLSGDTIYFSPTAFIAQSAIGSGRITLNQSVSLQLVLHGGRSIDSISLTEGGTFRLAGSQSDVYADGELRGFGLAAPGNTLVAAITPDTGFGPNATGSPQAWNGAATLGFAGSGIDQSAGVGVTLQNVLTARTTTTDPNPLQVAMVQISPAGNAIALNVTMVPEPEGWAMLLAGLGVLTAARRRRNRVTA